MEFDLNQNRRNLFIISIVLFIASRLNIELVSFELFNEDDKKLAIIITHYALIYILFSYYYKYISSIFHRSLAVVITAGFYLIFSIIMEIILPSVFVFYILFKIDETCGCIISSHSMILGEFHYLMLWTGEYFYHLWYSLSALEVNMEEPINYISDWWKLNVAPWWQENITSFFDGIIQFFGNSNEDNSPVSDLGAEPCEEPCDAKVDDRQTNEDKSIFDWLFIPFGR